MFFVSYSLFMKDILVPESNIPLKVSSAMAAKGSEGYFFLDFVSVV